MQKAYQCYREVRHVSEGGFFVGDSGPARKSAFRITHRFGRPLGAGDFTDLVEDFFGFDSGANIGFEYRYGILKATQIAIHRTNNRTIQFLLEREVKGQTSD